MMQSCLHFCRNAETAILQKTSMSIVHICTYIVSNMAHPPIRSPIRKCDCNVINNIFGSNEAEICDFFYFIRP